MPELPEVNTVMLEFREVALDQQITKVEVFDDKILRNTSADAFAYALEGQAFTDTYRQGKYFFATLEGADILLHLGMTGDISYYYDLEDQPKYERFRITFEEGLMMGYADLRKFSHVLLLPDRDQYLREIALGPDALEISAEDFGGLFRGRSTSVKAVLLNQKLIAGIGNLYADEICFQARIHPGSTAGVLKTKQINRLYHHNQEILRTACERRAKYQVYPDDWFWKWRKQDVVLKGKGKVMQCKIAGRTTYFIPDYQALVK